MTPGAFFRADSSNSWMSCVLLRRRRYVVTGTTARTALIWRRDLRVPSGRPFGLLRLSRHTRRYVSRNSIFRDAFLISKDRRPPPHREDFEHTADDANFVTDENNWRVRLNCQKWSKQHLAAGCKNYIILLLARAFISFRVRTFKADPFSNFITCKTVQSYGIVLYACQPCCFGCAWIMPNHQC